METKFQTSFIPKKSMGGPEVYSYKQPFGMFLIISICIASLSILIAGGTFIYKAILNREVKAKEAILEKKAADLKSSEIDALVRFADKIDSASKLLDSHLAVTPIFTLLEQTTIKRLQFTELTYTYLSNNKIAVGMKGVAKNFGVVARQSDAFAEVTGAKFTNSIFTDLNYDLNGNAIFSFLTTVDPNLILYKNTLGSQQSEPSNNEGTSSPSI